MKLFKKLILGAILGLSLCVGLFFTNNIKPKATENVLNPILDVNDIPIGAKITFNTTLTNPGFWRFFACGNYNGTGFSFSQSGTGTYLNIRGDGTQYKGVYLGTNKIYDFTNGWTNSTYKEIYVVNAPLNIYSGSSLQDPTNETFLNWLNANTTITYTPPVQQTTLNFYSWQSGTTWNYRQNYTTNTGESVLMDFNALSEHEGYTFLGWNTTADMTLTAQIPVNQEWTPTALNYNLYEVWRANNTAIVSFNGNGGTGTAPPSVGVLEGSNYTLPNNTFTKTHYDFVGWSRNANASYNDTGVYSVGQQVEILSDTIFYAVWRLEQETLTLNLQGGSITGGTTRTYDYNTQVNLNTLGSPLKVGFIFLGWGLTADATSYVSTITMTTNKTIYAIWGTATNDLATITYYPNGATSGYVPSSQQVVKGTQYNVEGNPGNLEREGYTFIGWGTTADATTPITTLYPNANVSLYAIWSQLQYATGNIYINNVLICELRIYSGNETTFATGFYNFGANYFTMTLNPQNGLEVVDYNSNYIWSIVDGYITYTFNGEYFMNITIQSTRNNYVETLTKTQMQPIYSNNTPYENGGSINYYITIDGSNDDIDNFRNVVGNIFNSVQTLLNVQIGWFSMGGIIAIVLAIGVMFFIFKIARGGGNS